MSGTSDWRWDGGSHDQSIRHIIRPCPKGDFLRRIIPLVLADARFGTWRDRVAYAEHWEKEFKAMEDKFRHLAEADFRLYKAMQEWHNRIGDMLQDLILGRTQRDGALEEFSAGNSID